MVQPWPDSKEAPPHSEDLTLTLSLCSDDEVLAITQLLSKQSFHLGVIWMLLQWKSDLLLKDVSRNVACVSNPLHCDGSPRNKENLECFIFVFQTISFIFSDYFQVNVQIYIQCSLRLCKRCLCEREIHLVENISRIWWNPQIKQSQTFNNCKETANRETVLLRLLYYNKNHNHNYFGHCGKCLFLHLWNFNLVNLVWNFESEVTF